MRILALIPARGGSKRVPKKNIRELGGKPLINWSIEAAQGLPEFVDILVSTDSTDIAEIAGRARALVPWLRPPELATDTATSVNVALHALNWYEAEHGKVDGLMLLQPTSPFRSAETIQRAAALFQSCGCRPVVSVNLASSHPAWCFRVKDEIMIPFLGREELERRSQDLSPVYALNGAIYVVSPATLREKKKLITENACPLVMHDPAESLDIDTDWDWLLAEFVQKKRSMIKSLLPY